MSGDKFQNMAMAIMAHTTMPRRKHVESNSIIIRMVGHVHGGTVVGGRGVIFCSTNTRQTRRLTVVIPLHQHSSDAGKISL